MGGGGGDLGSKLPSRTMHSGTVQPIENRAVQQYSGQSSSSHRGAETDPYARYDYDAARCPTIFTGLPPSKSDATSLTAACPFTSTGVLCASSSPSCKGTGLIVLLLSRMGSGVGAN